MTATTQTHETIEQLTSIERLTFKKLLDSPLGEKFESISQKINSQNPRQLLYHFDIQSTEIPVCKCGTVLSWHADKREYRKYCSKKCTAHYSVKEKKQNNLKNLGVEWHTQTKEWQEKTKQTSLERYGAEHYSKTTAYKSAVKNTSREKYGVDHIMQLGIVKEKTKQAWQEKYGFDNPAKVESVKSKIESTNLKRYGESCVLKNSKIQDKIKTTNKKKYGVENPAQNSEIRKQISQTRRKNYYPENVLSRLENHKWLVEQNSQGKSVGEIAQDLEVSPSNLAKLFHKHDLEIQRHQHSFEENILFNLFSADYNIVRNSRSIINPQEIDLYFEEFLLGIEVNGIYFHSEKFNKTQTYHLDKTIKATEAGINLLHFWDFEVRQKTSIVANIIKSKLHTLENSIHGRKTQVVSIDKHAKKQFLNQNHLQGNCSSSVDLGLIYNNKIVAVACFSHNRFSKNTEYELIRLCSLENHSVKGGASKLVKHFARQYMKPGEKLVSYADRRYSQGKVYESAGFEFKHHSPPGFFYVDKQGNYAGSRHAWQKHLLENKLENFDKDLSAEINMQINGYHKVWDCGQSVYIFEN